MMASDDNSQDDLRNEHRDDRKSARTVGPGVHDGVDGMIYIGEFAAAREVLRSDGLRQAGFRAELLERFAGRKNAPVLFQDGEAHQKQRSSTARFFAPKIVATRYRDLMEELSEQLVERFRSAGRAELDAMSLEMAVAVAAEIVGLTESSQAGTAQRLNRFFDANGPQRGWLAAVAGFAAGQYKMLTFYLRDVRPAIRARRKTRREDVISHLLDQGYSDREILTECLTYGAAGMATTREFIVMAAWHLYDDAELKQRFLAADEATRVALLEEILRLEPVVGALYRRAERELKLEGEAGPLHIRAGALVKVDVRAANTDRGAAGACPFKVDADRDVSASRASDSLMSFGDGPHRCPGAAVALQETAIFLGQLLRVPNTRLIQPPTVGWNSLISSYELRGAVIST
jgi:cytochrome P450